MSGVSTHILDTVAGEPARGVVVRLEWLGSPAGAGTELGRGVTDADGRISDFGVAELSAGAYRLIFETGPYLSSAQTASGQAAEPPFFPEVIVTFQADGRRPRYHVPLLLSPYSYATY